MFENNDLVRLLKKIAKDFNVNIYLVGGAIRDSFLGADSTDYDFVVETSVEKHFEISKYISKLFNCEFKYNDYYKTAKFEMNGIDMDLVMARSEFYPYPASKPIIKPAKIYDDIARRDFTINTLALNLVDNSLIDFFDGREDIKNGIVRILHNQSFRDDPTRIFRAIKYSSRFGFKYDDDTLKEMYNAIDKGYIKLLPYQRIKNELFDTLKENNKQMCVNQMIEFNILDAVFGMNIKINKDINFDSFTKLNNEEKLISLLYDNDLYCIELIAKKFELRYDFVEICNLISEIKQKIELNNKVDVYLTLLENEKRLNDNLLYTLFDDISIRNFLLRKDALKIDKDELMKIEEYNRKKYITDYKLKKLLEHGGTDDV